MRSDQENKDLQLLGEFLSYKNENDKCIHCDNQAFGPYAKMWDQGILMFPYLTIDGITYYDDAKYRFCKEHECKFVTLKKGIELAKEWHKVYEE